RDDRLMKWLIGHLDRFLDELTGIEVVPKRTTGDFWQLPIMAIGKNCKVLPARREVRCKPCARKSIGDGISSEARDALLTVGNDRRPSCFKAFDRIGNGCVLRLLQLILGNFLGIVGSISLLQLER